MGGNEAIVLTKFKISNHKIICVLILFLIAQQSSAQVVCAVSDYRLFYLDMPIGHAPFHETRNLIGG